MKEKKLFVKMFIVFASFFVLFILGNSQVFASSDEGRTFKLKPSELNKEYTVFVPYSVVPAEYSHYLFFFDKNEANELNSCFDLYFSKEPFKVSVGFGGDKVYSITPGASYLLTRKIIYYASNYSLNMDSADSYTTNSTYGTVSSVSGHSYILDASDNIVDTSTGETVFHPAKETILVPIAKSMDFLAVIKEILEILPMILVVLIGLLGLMKAIRQMLKMLRQA